jgi:hypothetical protein
MNEEELNYPISICKREFQSLIDEFDFKTISFPKWDIINVFRYGLSNGTVTIYLTIMQDSSIGYGTLVNIKDNYNHDIELRDLIPRWREQLNYFKENGERKSLEEQIIMVVQRLRTYAKDILNGDLTRFNQIVEKNNKIIDEIEKQHHFGRYSKLDNNPKS